jgi:hypothetical protein
MSNLQNLIERIVEAKVNALLEADVYQKSARKGGRVVSRMSKKTKPGTSRAEADKKPAENFSKMQKLRNKNKKMNWEKVADYQKRMKKHGTDADRMRHDNVNDPWPSR